MGYIDLHCDTLMLYAAGENRRLYENNLAVDIKRLKKAGAYAQFFAIWMPDKETIVQKIKMQEYSDEKYYNTLLTGADREIKEYGDIISHAGSFEAYLANKASGKISAFLTLEDGRIAGGSLEKLYRLKRDGISLITLTWNERNCFGAPASYNKNIMAEGLTGFGKEAVAFMQDEKIIVDVSHLSDGGFMDVTDICRKPFIASHSNARGLVSHPRNLSDKMLKLIGERGGVAGLNFCPDFLNTDRHDKRSTVKNICMHAKYMSDKAGIESVAVGSDLDGIKGDIEIDSTDKIYMLNDGLKAAGFSEDDIDKIMWKNAERVLESIW